MKKIFSEVGIKQMSEEETIDLLELANAIIRRWYLVVGAALILGAVAFGGSKLLIDPTYQATFTAYVNNSSSSDSQTITSSDVTASRNLADTYSAIIKGRSVVEQTIWETGLGIPYEQLANAVSVNTVSNTELIRVSVVTTDPDISYKLAAGMETVSVRSVEHIVQGSSMIIVESTRYSDDIYEPNYKRIAMMGAMLGAVLAAAGIILANMLDTRIKSPDELQQKYGIVIMGTIHDLQAVASNRSYGSYGKHPSDLSRQLKVQPAVSQETETGRE